MRNKLTDTHPDLFARSGIVTAVAVAGGYWASQIYATNFVSNAEAGTSPAIAGALSLVLFGVLFTVHLLRPWSRAAAILGLCSFAVFTGLMWYYTGPEFHHYVPTLKAGWVISTILGVVGLALDVERCWRLCSPTLSESFWLKLGHKGRATLHNAFHPKHF